MRLVLSAPFRRKKSKVQGKCDLLRKLHDKLVMESSMLHFLQPT
jgi:hypothetical protein